MLSISLILLAGVVVWIRTATVKSTYEFVRQERDLKRMQEEMQNLRIRWLKLTSPSKLETLAQNQGMSPPKYDQVVKIKPENGKR